MSSYTNFLVNIDRIYTLNDNPYKNTCFKDRSKINSFMVEMGNKQKNKNSTNAT